MEITDWQNAIAVGMGIAITLGAFLMMFTNAFTTKKKK